MATTIRGAVHAHSCQRRQCPRRRRGWWRQGRRSGGWRRGWRSRWTRSPKAPVRSEDRDGEGGGCAGGGHGGNSGGVSGGCLGGGGGVGDGGTEGKGGEGGEDGGAGGRWSQEGARRWRGRWEWRGGGGRTANHSALLAVPTSMAGSKCAEVAILAVSCAITVSVHWPLVAPCATRRRRDDGIASIANATCATKLPCASPGRIGAGGGLGNEGGDLAAPVAEEGCAEATVALVEVRAATAATAAATAARVAAWPVVQSDSVYAAALVRSPRWLRWTRRWTGWRGLGG